MNPTEQDLASKGFVKLADGSWRKGVLKLNAPKEDPICPKCGGRQGYPNSMTHHGAIHACWCSRPDSDLAGQPEKHRPGTGVPTSSVSTMEQKLNKTEKRWLAVLRLGGYEPGIQDVTLRLGFDLRYTPDFRTITVGCQITFWEVKGGYEREDAAVKIKMAAAKFPFWRFIKVVWKDGQWTETVVRP